MSDRHDLVSGMRDHKAFIPIFIAGALFAGAGRLPAVALASTSGCGGPRAAIATLSDPGAGGVSLDPLRQQVVDLNNWPAPPYLYDDVRAGGIEGHVYAVTAELLGSMLQPNGDLDLVLAQPGDERWTIVAVLPDPTQCGQALASSEAADMQAARSNIASTIGLHAGAIPGGVSIVRVTGAGFFNPSAGGPGEAINGLELSPVIGFALVGPAALMTFPVLPPASSSAAVSTPPSGTPSELAAGTAPQAAGAASQGTSTTSPSPTLAAVAPASTATQVSSAAAASASAGGGISAPVSFAASQQQISDALASSAPVGSELPAAFSNAVLATAGQGSGASANAYDLDFVLLGASSGQPAGVLTYLIFAGPDDARSSFTALQGAVSQAGGTTAPIAGQQNASFCAQPIASGSGAPCAILVGSVLVVTQAGDTATALAAAQAGVAHLLRLVPAS
ncbi:MAG TPA: hypothetical protein VK821_19585 [Dehalococcoidia bacterium]|nr:hypothetical protein [Dehalococcoidia bacterium]